MLHRIHDLAREKINDGVPEPVCNRKFLAVLLAKLDFGDSFLFEHPSKRQKSLYRMVGRSSRLFSLSNKELVSFHPLVIPC
jgi:hypothetical protein